jgi:hypothetical protein
MSGWMGERSMPSTWWGLDKVGVRVGRDIRELWGTPWLLIVSYGSIPTLRQYVPISRHHFPVPHPISSMRFGRLSGANQFLWPNSAFIMACCMSSRSFSACVRCSQRRTNRGGRSKARSVPHRWETDMLCTVSACGVVEVSACARLTSGHISVVCSAMLVHIVPYARREGLRFAVQSSAGKAQSKQSWRECDIRFKVCNVVRLGIRLQAQLVSVCTSRAAGERRTSASMVECVMSV